MPIDLAISPCPNDTFIFGHFVQPGFFEAGPVELHFADVEELNRRAINEQRHIITKVSYFAAWKLRGSYELLDCGGALGRGCGPILVSPDGALPGPDDVILVPGRWTTAHLLLRLFLQGLPNPPRVEHTTYEKVIPGILSGHARFGVIIHEERFTFQAKGLSAVQDLGVWWETRTGLPIPLGAILLRRDHLHLKDALQTAIRSSIKRAELDFESIREFVRCHSQSLEDDVIQAHIHLYVNALSMDPGEDGRRAIQTLFDYAEKARL
ncbi:MAG: 1,4-dihydroxy-6-naphthoate synthase [Spirochaetia bacterium]|nr:1,4-dihydroxy-6-naphthoate synthase [Spirochaetia bacterium]